MRKIEVLDTTLRDGEQAPDNTMEPKQKLEIALALADAGIDVIEAGMPVSSREDYEGVRLVAENVKSAGVCALARCKKEDIDFAKDALRSAKDPWIHIFLPTSKLHLKTKFGCSESESLEIIRDQVTYAKNYFDKIIFGAEDATRSRTRHLKDVVDFVSSLGVRTIVLADTTGYSAPEEFRGLVRQVSTNTSRRNLKIGVHCHNDLGMATANTLSGILGGANHIQVTVNGIGERAGNTSLEETIVALNIRADVYGCKTNVKTDKLLGLSQLVYRIIGREPSYEKPIVGKNSFRHEAGIHVSAMLRDPKTYEIIDPASVGQERSFVYGRHSGKREKFK